jgi:hypothetical protein
LTDNRVASPRRMSGALTDADIDFAIAAFADAGKALGIV